MKYDFDSVIYRRDRSASKWLRMDEDLGFIDELVIPFTVADLDLPIAPEIKEGLLRFIEGDGVFGYTAPSTGFYDAVCGWFKHKHNWSIEKEWIVNSLGVINAISTALYAYSQENDGVIVFTPVYYPFFSAIEQAQRNLKDFLERAKKE